MNEQRSLFVESPAVRARDPWTSAAAVPSLQSRRQRCREVYAALLAHPDGATAHEVGEWLFAQGVRMAENAVARRFGDLEDLGLAVRPGDTRPGAYKREQEVAFALPPRNVAA